MSDLKIIADYFDRKTDGIIERYGPGPRVHYHTGIVDAAPTSRSITMLRHQLVAGQELMLSHAAALWGNMHGDVLDVGCGLGGGSIFWAENNPAIDSITAVTCAPSHVFLIKHFAYQTNVGPKIQPVLSDATDFAGENLFDFAIAVDSSGYLDRKLWFKCLARLLKPRGYVHLIDCFVIKEKYKPMFDEHWHTRIGGFGEYLNAAIEAGFQRMQAEDITRRTIHFWSTTIALINRETEVESEWTTQNPADLKLPNRLEKSLAAHELVHDGLSNGGLQYLIASWQNGK